MTRCCTKCREAFDATAAWQKLCWTCWRRDRDAKDRRQAWHDGYNAGLVAASADLARAHFNRPLSDEMLRDLIALCHPDRHPPERAHLANRATVALLDMRSAPSKALQPRKDTGC